MNKKQEKFVKTVWEFYDTCGRHGLPWRKTKDPYRIMLSEVMLQQTQVDRVLPKYKEFLEKFPTVRDLAAGSLGDVLRLWQGLGYNRRAKALHSAARAVVSEYDGNFPKTFEELKTLPGVGPYTAGAVMAFAYNKPISIIETNLRTVFIYHFFKDQEDIADADIQKLIDVTLDHERPREWYWALMDYGSYIKKEFGNPNKQSKTYVKQSKFTNSDRQIRGAILRVLAEQSYTRATLLTRLSQFEDIRVDAQTESLLKEGMITKVKQKYSLPK